MVKLTNISTGQLVCDLAKIGDKEPRTLRLDKKKSIDVEDKEITPHIENLVKKGLLFKESVATQTQTAKTSKKAVDAEKEKEEK